MNFVIAIASLLLWTGRICQAVKEVQQIYQFPNSAQFIENIDIRSNGYLLLDTFDDARMYTIHPQVKGADAQVATQVSGIESLTGIAEIAPDVFAVSCGTMNLSDYSFVQGTGKIVTVDFNSQIDKTGPLVTTVAQAPSARILNGLVSLPNNPNILLSGDSKVGSILRTNISSGRVDTVLQDDQLTPGLNPTLVPLGINGMKMYNGYLYLTNSGQRFYARLRISDVGEPLGKLQQVVQLPAQPPMAPDDFAITSGGTAYVAVHPNMLVKVTQDGSWSTIVDGNSTVQLESPTSVVLSADEKTAYLSTAGNNGMGGQVVMVAL